MKNGWLEKYSLGGEIMNVANEENPIAQRGSIIPDSQKKLNTEIINNRKSLEHRQQVYNTIRPSDYSDQNNYIRYLFGIKRNETDDVRSEEGFRKYLGIDNTSKYITPSSYRPVDNDTIKDSYYKLDPQLEQDIFNSYKDTVQFNKNFQAGEATTNSVFPENTPGLFTENSEQYVALTPNDKNIITGRPMTSRARMLGSYTVSKGKDDKGEYLSYRDRYDFHDVLQSQFQGKPYEIYGQVYYPKKKEGGNIIKDNNGYWNPKNIGHTVEINSGDITMQGVFEPLLGISKETGEKKLMIPGKSYNFTNTKHVIELPINNKKWLDSYEHK